MRHSRSFQNEDGTYKIAKLRQVNAALLSAAELERYKADTDATIRAEIMDEYFEALRKKYPVKRNADADKKVARAKEQPADIPNTLPQKK